MVANHWAAFGPRLGFAYDLTGSGKNIVRGGFGIMYERIQGNDMYQAGPNVPFSSSATLNNVSLSNPHQNVQNGSTIVAPPLPIIVPTISELNSARYNLPMSYQYSFGVQRSLVANSVLSVAYVGNLERNQSDAVNTNLPPFAALPSLAVNSGSYNTLLPYQGYHAILTDQDEANSSYNSLQAELHSTLRSGLHLQAAYTFSRAIDPTTGSGGDSFDLDTVSNPYVGWTYDNGPSIFDRTHQATNATSTARPTPNASPTNCRPDCGLACTRSRRSWNKVTIERLPARDYPAGLHVLARTKPGLSTVFASKS